MSVTKIKVLGKIQTDAAGTVPQNIDLTHTFTGITEILSGQIELAKVGGTKTTITLTGLADNPRFAHFAMPGKFLVEMPAATKVAEFDTMAVLGLPTASGHATFAVSNLDSTTSHVLTYFIGGTGA